MKVLLSVREAAAELERSPQRVRRLIADGVLPAVKVADAWAIDPAAVQLLSGRERPSGRPLNAVNAWAVLALLNGERPSWVRSDVRSRLRRRLRDPRWVHAMLGASEPRSAIMPLWLPREDSQKLLSEFPLVRSGLSAKNAGLDLLRYREESLDAYVPETVLSQIERRFLPEHASASEANVVLRVPNVEWVLQDSAEAPAAVVAADLLGHPDPRVDRAARDRLRTLARSA